MARTAAVPVSLFDSFARHAQERDNKVALDVSQANTRYWEVIDKIASGDPSGGVSRQDFADILTTLCTDLDHARADVATVQRVRQARRDLEALTVTIGELETRANAAHATLLQAQRTAAEAEGVFQRTAWAKSDAEQELTRVRLTIRDELRDVEAGLRVRGFTGELLAAPPPPPPPRRWRFRNGADASMFAGCQLADGSEVDMPADFCGRGQDTFGAPWAVCLGPVTPEMGPPHQVPVPMLSQGQPTYERAEDMVRGVEMEVA